MKITFFGIENWQKEYLKQRIIGHEVLYFKEPLHEVKDKNIYESDIICVFVFCKADKKTLSKFKNLKLISTMSAGFDHIDLEYCKKNNIIVTNASGYGDNTVAEFTFSLILNLTRKTNIAHEKSKTGNLSFEGFLGQDVRGKTLGVLGTGRIGQNLINISKGFNMKVVAYDLYPNHDQAKNLGFEYKTLDEVLNESDIISIHTPLLKSTHHMINKETINKMKTGVIIINTSRGPVINTLDLLDALKTNKVAGVGLDVLEEELAMKEHKNKESKIVKANKELLKMPNVIITPHLAFYTKEAIIRILDITLTNIFDLIEHRGYKNQIK
jgi:D-lactate dehydrogenase